MTMHDPIADLLTRVRNAQMARHPEVTMPSSVAKQAICKVLQDEGYVESFSATEGTHPQLTVVLRYNDGKPVIEEIDRVSRPGLRVYRGSNEIPTVRGGLGVAIVSTNRGVMTDRTARAQGVGGEVLCTVF